MPNATSQYTLFSPATSYNISAWNSNNNPQKYYKQHREKTSNKDIQSQCTLHLLENSYNTTANTNSQELNFSDEESLINWLYMAALAKDLLVKNYKQFVASKVWWQKLSKYLNASDFSEFKKSSSSLKSLENFVAESLKIHIKYLVAVHNQEKPSYSENVLAKIKILDQLTFHLTIPLAS
ncbi:914_t:CDS:2 [Cetraspora pellucida]|uniref:914_t:CDS:1 n=1 Tax=Cetraspora pellucida TaxID=1433469 RepID=A0A9N9IAM0_9GLOM|nr:914_t:CDS:2 [Cetraspora pellucida]